MAGFIISLRDKMISRLEGSGGDIQMQAPGPAVLLMKDKQGEESTSYVRKVPRTVIHNVLRGSLLTPIPVEKQIPRSDERAPHNYQTMYKDHTITLFCDEEDVSPLSDYDHLLLAGVQSQEARYLNFITPNKLDWGSQLKVGDHVLVSIPGPLAVESGATIKVSAVIQYVGRVEGLPGLIFGVEILDPHYYWQGPTDGTFRDKRYFTCPDGNGLFVSFDKLSEDPTGGSLPKPPPGGQHYTPHDGQQNGRRKPKAPSVAEPSTDPPPRFKVGDRVVIFNKKGEGVHGTVKWTGKYGYQDEKKKYHSFSAIGIETDVMVFTNEFESHLPRKSHTFQVRKGKGQIFVCEEEAMLEADYIGQEAPAEKRPVQPQQPKPYGGQPSQQPSTGKPPQESPRGVDIGDLAYEMGDRPTQFMQEQSEAERKNAKELEKLRLDVGSAVQLAQDPNHTGVIRWTGYIPNVQGLIAGVELDGPMEGCGDGVWRGHRYFSCLPERGFFCPAANLKPNDHEPKTLANKPPVQSQQTQKTESRLEQELRQEASQLRDQVAAQSLEQQRLRQQVEQLLKDQQRQTQQREQLQREKQQLESENQQHIHRLEQLQWEQRQQKEEFLRETQDRIQQLEQLQRKQQQKEELLRESRDRIQQLEQEKQLRVQEVHHLQQQLQQEQERSRRLQERLDTSAARPATQLLSIVQFNTVNRTEVQVQTKLGFGAWGEVARGKFKGQPVAVKWPHMELLQQYPNIIDRMRREVRIMAQVRHPNLVRFIAAVLDEAAERLQAPPMIITELMDTNLRLAYQQGRLQTTDNVTILRDVAYALHYLHEHLEPIIHRDISAPNVLLQALPNKGWLAKVSDFGSANLAKLAHTAGEGAIIYTAPEAFPSTDLEAEPPPMTTKIDVYSYGILICEVVTSRPPFTENLRGMLQQVKTKWEFMYNLIARCTKHSAEDRPTMAQVLDELNTLPRPPPRSLPRPQQ